MNAPLTLAIDFGATCGLVIGDSGMMVSRSLAKGTDRDALLSTLDTIAAAARPARIVYSMPTALAAKRETRAPLVQAVRDWAAKHGLDCTALANVDVKRAFTGAGNASTLAVVLEAERRGFAPSGAAEARAIAVFHRATVAA